MCLIFPQKSQKKKKQAIFEVLQIQSFRSVGFLQTPLSPLDSLPGVIHFFPQSFQSTGGKVAGTLSSAATFKIPLLSLGARNSKFCDFVGQKCSSSGGGKVKAINVRI